MSLETILIIWLPLNAISPEQGEAHIPIQTPIRDPEQVLQFRSRFLHSRPTNAISQHSRCAGCPFHAPSIPVPYLLHAVPDQTKYLAHTHPVSLLATSKSQSSFQTLQIKCAIQTLWIRQHGNVHAGHSVLISSHMKPGVYRLSLL